MPIDNLIAFAGSEAGAGYFGAELARNITAHAEEIKLAGAEYCDCPACAAVAEILARKKSCCEGFQQVDCGCLQQNIADKRSFIYLKLLLFL